MPIFLNAFPTCTTFDLFLALFFCNVINFLLLEPISLFKTHPLSKICGREEKINSSDLKCMFESILTSCNEIHDKTSLFRDDDCRESSTLFETKYLFQ